MKNSKKVLVTGGAQRIGSSITKHLINNGFDVAIQFNTSGKNVNKLKNLFQIFFCQILKHFNSILKEQQTMKNFLKKLKRSLEILIF